MQRRLLSIIAIALAAALGARTPTAHAQDPQQVVFYGFTAPRGSLSAPGQGEAAAYLLWESVGPSMPSSVALIRLYRGATLLGEWPVEPAPTAAAIDALYADPAQARRALEQRQLLCALARADQIGADTPPEPCTPADLAQLGGLGERIAAHLQDMHDPGNAEAGLLRAWAYFGSRRDVNVARARGRAFVDPVTLGPTPQALQYRLEGVSNEATPRTVTMGQITVDVPAAGAPAWRAPAPRALRAVTPREKGVTCGGNDAARADGVLSLTWGHPGDGSPASDLYAQAIIAGYDVYRAADAIPASGACGAVDLRALAAAQGHDPVTGDVVLPGFVRLNEAPVLLVPPADDDPTQLQLDKRATRALGMYPGDTFCVYAVGRDPSGNYGEAAVAKVTLPALTGPVAPWDVRLYTESARSQLSATAVADSDRARLEWSHVDVLSYYHDYSDGRAFCNLDSAVREGRLAFAEDEPGCLAGPGEVRVNVAGYALYRFDSEREAAAFVDTDGDGYADEDERTAYDLLFEQSVASDPCDPSSIPMGYFVIDGDGFEVASHLAAEVPVAGARPEPDGRRTVVFDEPELPANKGKILYYRVASVAPDGTVGASGPPIRAFFPPEEMPPRPETVMGTYECLAQGDVIGSIGVPFATDYTCRAETLRVKCDTSAFERCLEAVLDDVGEAELLEACREATELLGVGFEAFVQEPREQRIDRLMERIAAAQIVDLPFDRSDCMRLGDVVRAGHAYLGPLECSFALLPRLMGPPATCAPVVQYLDGEGRPIRLYEKETGTPEAPGPVVTQLAIHPGVNPNIDGSYEPEEPDAPSMGCWLSSSLSGTSHCEVRPVPPGRTVSAVTLVTPVAPGRCVSTFQRVTRDALPSERDPTISGPQYTSEVFRVALDCAPETCAADPVTGQCQVVRTVPVTGTTCLGTAAHSASNVVSPPRSFDCRQGTPVGKPLAPVLQELAFVEPGRATFAWQRASGAAAGVIVEWQRDDGTGTSTAFIAADPARERVTASIDLFGAASVQPPANEIWCLRARLVGVAAQDPDKNLSDWTSPLCAPRAPPSTPPSNAMPWPPTVLPPRQAGLVPGQFMPGLDGGIALTLGVLPDRYFRTASGEAEQRADFTGVLACEDWNGSSNCGYDRRELDLPGSDASLTECRAATSGSGPLTSCGWRACTGSDPGLCLEGPRGVRSPQLCAAVAAVALAQGAFVAYRQERAGAATPAGPFVQVSGRVERLQCEPGCIVPVPGAAACEVQGTVLDDDDIKVVQLAGEPLPRSVVYADRFPLRRGHQYRYQLVYFDARGEPTKWAESDWIQAGN